MDMRGSAPGAVDCSHSLADSHVNIPSPLHDLDLFLRNHQLHCDCGSTIPQPLPDRRTEEIRNLLKRASYRDWRIFLHDNPDAAPHALAISFSPQPNETDGDGIRVHVCPAMTDEFVVDLLFEMVKHVEVKLAHSRFTVAA